MSKVIIAAPRPSVEEQEGAHPRSLRVAVLLIVSRVPSTGKERRGFSETCHAPKEWWDGSPIQRRTAVPSSSANRFIGHTQIQRACPFLRLPSESPESSYNGPN